MQQLIEGDKSSNENASLIKYLCMYINIEAYENSDNNNRRQMIFTQSF